MPAGAAPDQLAQIEKAVQASPLLAQQLSDVAADGRLARIDIVATDRVRLAGAQSPFRAGISGTDMRITQGLLKDLQVGCAFRPAKLDEICPDNTVFVLGHLAYLAKTAKDMADVDAQRLPALRAVDGTPRASSPVDVSDLIGRNVMKRLEREAAAFITGWNCVVDEATVRNARPLTRQQIVSMMANLRYRFALFNAAIQGNAPLTVLPSGLVELSARNIQAVRAVLAESAIADIE